MYLGMLIMLTGVAVFMGTLPFYVATATLFAILNFVFCPYEEDKLARTFGRSHEQYRQRVRRWF
jgi:protein-S-isoprenylcysteine O-methyltransferase Ste14